MTTWQHRAFLAPHSGAFWRAYAIHMRPYLLFVSGITGVAGLSFFADFSVPMGLLLSLAFFLSYGFGQALTDCFQTDTDSISSPYRPLVQGTIRRQDVLAVSLAGLTACAVLMALGNPLVIPLTAVSILGLLTYTFFKRRWWAGPFYNAWIVAILFLIGVLDGTPHAGFEALVRLDVALVAAVVFFGYANFVLAGYFKDVSADRATGYDTLPVRYGLRVAAWVSDLFAVLAVGGAIGALVLVMPPVDSLSAPIIPLLFLAAGAGASLTGQMRLHRVRNDSEAHRAIQPVVHTFVLLLSSVAVALQPAWTVPLILFHAGFWATMWRRPAAAQI
jgi:4-hydroxybenzoate polyprenyltransferase